MLDIAPSELLLCAIVALVVIGPKDLPRALRFAGKWMGKARKMARHFNAGVDNIIREAELQDLKKEWAEHNRRIMEQFPNVPDYSAVTPDAMLASVMPPEGAVPSGPAMPAPPPPAALPSAPAQAPLPLPSGAAGDTHARMPRAPVQAMPDWSEDDA